jgi:hypothetical protein
VSDTTAEAPLSGEADAHDARQRASSRGGPAAEAVTAGPTITIGADGGTVPIVPLLLVGFGGYLMWFAIHYWRGTGAAVWPSYPVKSVLQGKGLPPNTPAPPASQQVAAYEQGIGQEAKQGGQPPGPGGPPPTGSAQHMAKLLLPRYGWAPTELAPLILLWNRESGWRACAYNVSGAYGVAQALGHGSGACAVGPRCDGASSPGLNCAYGGYGQSAADSRAANAGNILKQIEWGLNYIKSTYGTPSSAWAHEQQFGWY